MKKEEVLLKAHNEISEKTPNFNEMAFIHSILCQVGLPRAKILSREFIRKSGEAWMSIQAGVIDEGNGPVFQTIPYGVTPRLALSWVSTYAKKNKTRIIPIGESASDFLKIMDMHSCGARYASLRVQMHALAACRLQLGYKGRTFNGQPVEQFDAWISNKENRQRSLWPGVMTLSEGYFNELIEFGVPLDNRALYALKNSSLALDIYTWLAHRLYRITKSTIINWKSLQEQFGQEYQGKDADKNFKKAFLVALKDTLSVYPQARVTQISGGILLMTSATPVTPRNNFITNETKFVEYNYK